MPLHLQRPLHKTLNLLRAHRRGGDAPGRGQEHGGRHARPGAGDDVHF